MVMPPLLTPAAPFDCRCQSSIRLVIASLALAVLSVAAGECCFAQHEPTNPPPADIPIEQIKIKVVDGNDKSVADAPVEITDLPKAARSSAEARGAILSERTDGDGIATLKIPNDGSVDSVVAFKPGVGLDYFLARQSDPKQPARWPNEITLKLRGARTASMKALDKQKRPLPDVRFAVTSLVLPDKIAMRGGYGEPYGIEIGDCEYTTAATDASGVATFDWLPVEFLDRIRFKLISRDYNAAHQVGFAPTLPQLFQKHPDEPLTAVLVHRTKISGKVNFADGRPAEGIIVSADGTSSEGESARGSARTSADGSYEMFVESDRTYTLMVIDPIWAAMAQERIRAQGEPISDIDYRLAKGTILHGTVTEGPNHDPMPNQTVVIKRLPTPNGADAAKPGGNECPFYLEPITDTAGHYKVCVGPGTYSVGLWCLPAEDIVVKSQPDIVKDVTLPTTAVKPLTGKVLLNGKPAPNVSISGIYEAYLAHFYETATTGPDGSFQVKREPLRLALQAKSSDGKFGAMARIDERQENITIKLSPLAEAKGRLVDAHGKPVTTGKLEYGIAAETSAGRYKLLFRGEAVPDAQGKYLLNGLARGPTDSAYGGRCDEVIVNYWPDAKEPLDPQRQCELPYYSAAEKEHFLTIIEPTQSQTIDLGDTPIPNARR
jgi:hypothetical protein